MAPPGLRSPDDAPRPPGAGSPGPGPATLAGGPPGGEEDEAGGPGGGGGGMSGKLGEAVQQIMKTEVTVTEMARQFPAAAPALREAAEGLRTAGRGLRAALRQVMANPGQPEPPAPNIGG